MESRAEGLETLGHDIVRSARLSRDVVGPIRYVVSQLMTARCGEEPTQRGSRLHPAGERPGWCGLDRLRSRLAPHHSASWEDEHFAKFGAVLIRMARREAEQHQRRRVVGVYVGWRGESAAVPFLPLLTVWTRYSTAASATPPSRWASCAASPTRTRRGRGSRTAECGTFARVEGWLDALGLPHGSTRRSGSASRLRAGSASTPSRSPTLARRRVRPGPPEGLGVEGPAPS